MVDYSIGKKNELELNILSKSRLDSNDKTISVGSTMDGGVSFDDYEFVKNYKNIRVKEVLLGDDELYFKGIHFIYEVDGETVSPGPHAVYTNAGAGMITDSSGKVITERRLILEEDEYIKEIVIRAGAIIDRCTLITNKGNFISSGGNGGSPVYYVAPEGFQFISCEGTVLGKNNYNYWTTVHSLSFKADTIIKE